MLYLAKRLVWQDNTKKLKETLKKTAWAEEIMNSKIPKGHKAIAIFEVQKQG